MIAIANDSKRMNECACLRGKLRVVYRTSNLPKKWSMDFQNILWGDMPYMKTMDVYISCMFDANKTFGTWKNWNCHILLKHI
jgi:hypothetical protein